MNPRDLLELIRRVLWTPLPVAVSRRAESKLVLVCLATHATPDGTSAYPSRDTLAAHCELSNRTVDKILRELATAGVIGEQLPPTRTRPRTWRLLNACGQPVENGAATTPDGWKTERTLATGWKMTRESGAKTVPIGLPFSTDQVQVQVQEQEQYEERAAALRAATLASADANYKVILRLAHLVLDTVNAGRGRCSLDEIVEAVKEQCARQRIVYGSAVVHRAVASALVQRVKPTAIDAAPRAPLRREGT